MPFFVYSIRECSNFILLCIVVQFPPAAIYRRDRLSSIVVILSPMEMKVKLSWSADDMILYIKIPNILWALGLVFLQDTFP